MKYAALVRIVVQTVHEKGELCNGRKDSGVEGLIQVSRKRDEDDTDDFL